MLSTSVTLRERARTTRSIIDSSTYIGRSAVVEGAIVGRSCDLRSHVRVHEGVAIGDEVTIGAESVIMPGVRIYPYKEVETGAHLFESLIWESRGTARIFGKDGVSGLVNVDLTPDVAVRLASALGTALKRGARVVASREGTPACRMIKRAMISGLSSTGVDVADLRVIPAAVARHLLKSEGYDGGVHVGVSPSDPEAIRIQFFEPPGIEMSAATQKEVEKHFTRGEIRRVASTDVGRISYPARARETYASDLLSTLDVEAIRARQLPHRRRLRLLGRVVRPAARTRAARRRGGRRARIPERRETPKARSPHRWCRRSGSSRRSAPTSAWCSTGPASASTSSTSRRARSRSSRRCSCTCA